MKLPLTVGLLPLPFSWVPEHQQGVEGDEPAGVPESVRRVARLTQRPSSHVASGLATAGVEENQAVTGAGSLPSHPAAPGKAAVGSAPEGVATPGGARWRHMGPPPQPRRPRLELLARAAASSRAGRRAGRPGACGLPEEGPRLGLKGQVAESEEARRMDSGGRGGEVRSAGWGP